LLFRLDARLQNLGAKLKVGDYTIRRDMSIDQTIGALQIYSSKTIQITVPEGLRSDQIAAILHRHGINSRQFLREVRHPDLRLAVLTDKPRGASLEGYLFPNTYDVPPNYSGRDFAYLMVKTLQNSISPSMHAAMAHRKWSMYQVLTLASIVEREARVAAERPIIAGVYVNRLKAGMVLNADPTIQYAVGTPGNWWPLLTLAQLKVASPYNTYVRGGLPPGPIANPGLASVLAAIYPKHTKYFYFVARGHGRHIFAVTYAQQLINQARYQH
jgi:UPF0755 protein